MLAGDGLGPHGLGAGGVGKGPQPDMGIFAMMATIGTVPMAVPRDINSECSISLTLFTCDVRL